MTVSVVKQDPNTKRFKGTLLYFDRHTVYPKQLLVLDLTCCKFHSQQPYLQPYPPKKWGRKKREKKKQQ